MIFCAPGDYDCQLGSKLLDGSWLAPILKKDNYFYAFLKEWILHVQESITEGSEDTPLKSMIFQEGTAINSNFDWCCMKGYLPFLFSFIQALLSQEQVNYGRILAETCTTFLITDASILNAYMRLRFPRTNACNVTDTLGNE